LGGGGGGWGVFFWGGGGWVERQRSERKGGGTRKICLPFSATPKGKKGPKPPPFLLFEVESRRAIGRGNSSSTPTRPTSRGEEENERSETAAYSAEEGRSKIAKRGKEKRSGRERFAFDEWVEEKEKKAGSRTSHKNSPTLEKKPTHGTKKEKKKKEKGRGLL